jgi:hypothetical protein
MMAMRNSMLFKCLPKVYSHVLVAQRLYEMNAFMDNASMGNAAIHLP